jgi:acetylornithine deacetylase
MDHRVDSAKIFDQIKHERVLQLEQALLRIPSSSFSEGDIADFLAGWLDDLGFDVEMMQVTHPHIAGKHSRQPVARLRGTGGGPTLMINGHMDPGVEMSGWSVDPYGAKFENGWIWGMGAHDDKGGLASAISGLEGIIKANIKLKGDVLITPVVAHKYGGAGTRALLAQGVSADMCINMEHSNNSVANVCVGIVMARIRTRSPELFFRFSKEARDAYINPLEQQMEIVRRIGPSLTPAEPGGWLGFNPHPDLPGFPMHTFDTIHKEHYYFPNHTGMSSRECEMTFQLRTVPGQTLHSVTADLKQLLEGIRKEHPAFDYTLTIPATQPEDFWCQDPMECKRGHPLVESLAEGQQLASGQEPHVGGYGRLGNVGDGNILAAAGIPTVQYGPGDIRIYKEWPTPDERVLLNDLVIAARAVAHATWKLCK